MNNSLRSELERLKERQAQLHHAIDLLGIHVAALEKKITEGDHAVEEVAAPMAVPPLLESADSGNVQHSTFNIQLPTAPAVQPATCNLEPATADAKNTGLESPVNRQAGKPALHVNPEPET